VSEAAPRPRRLPPIRVRNTGPGDIPGVIELCRLVYSTSPPWREDQLASHQSVFPGGQFVAVEEGTGRVVGMAASLIVVWDDYEMESSWRDITDYGMFTNHDPKRGRTLYAAEVMVDPAMQRRGVGKKLYAARADLVRRLGLRRIRAGARLRGYHRHAAKMSPEAYVERVVAGQLRDPTLTFQLRQGFRVIAVVSGYLLHDEESLGHAAVIEWLP
jgi:GNAT superfamily N-acetyltransferase